jgi:hypothetical protein
MKTVNATCNAGRLIFSGARLCFHCMETLALARRQREKPLPLVAFLRYDNL